MLIKVIVLNGLNSPYDVVKVKDILKSEFNVMELY